MASRQTDKTRLWHVVVDGIRGAIAAQLVSQWQLPTLGESLGGPGRLDPPSEVHWFDWVHVFDRHTSYWREHSNIPPCTD
ncbi:hypothetical protein AB1N83_012859 [Pleurotus pulmonarius]